MSGVVNCPSEISCSCTLEWLSTNGTVNKSVKVKRVTLIIVRNEFRDIFMSVQSKEVNQKLLMKDVVIFKKFVDEGKATIKFPESKMNLMIYNAPPSALISFLKTIFIKLCSSKSSPKTSIRDKLLSTKEKQVQEVSPISSKDLGRAKSVKTPPVSAGIKRKAEVTHSSLELKAKKLCLTDQAPKLTAEQQRVLHEVKRGANIFFTGSAGTGKSYLLQEILQQLPPECTVATASTGSAACLIGGVTLHSFAGIGNGEGTKEKCLQLAMRNHVRQNWKNCSHLIIDEISMIDSELFEKIEWVARHVRNNEKPFGGLQVIVSGDFLQLPPVNKQSKSQQTGRFCFSSEAWQSCRFSVFYLKQVHRQTDPHFIDILNSIRIGQITPEITEKLASTASHNIEQSGILATRLCCYTREAKNINESKLNDLPGEAKLYTAIDLPESGSSSGLLDDCTPVERVLHLKEGAQVMLLKNISVSRGFVNGARGVIEGFSSGFPVVKFISGVKYTVKQEKWTVKTPQGCLLVRKQLPLKLAWAFSIHKSQGLTLDCVEMSLNSVFEPGQAYVALSRAKSLSTLRVLGFNPKQVFADPDVLKFYKRISYHHQEFVALGKPRLSLPGKSVPSGKPPSASHLNKELIKKRKAIMKMDGLASKSPSLF